jgi:hypothetical protein
LGGKLRRILLGDSYEAKANRSAADSIVMRDQARKGEDDLSEPQRDVFLESWLRRLLISARRRARAGPTTAQLSRLRRRIVAVVGPELSSRQAA